MDGKQSECSPARAAVPAQPPPSELSPAARAVLTTAAARDDGIALPPERLPAAAQHAVVRSLLKAGLLRGVQADSDGIALRITDTGCHAIGASAKDLAATGLLMTAREASPGAEAAHEAQQHPTAPAATQEAPSAPLLPTGRPQALRYAALAVLAAWDSAAEASPALPAAVDGLRAALATTRAARAPCEAPRQPRTDTKQATVLALLRRPEGASGPAMAEATGWAPHTVRGFLAGLAKRGHTVTVLDRVRQVGPGKEGAKSSYTVYRVMEAG